MRVLMVAAENDAIAGAKVGGVADVVRDVPQALAQNNIDVDVVIPDYGDYANRLNGQLIAHVDIHFRHQKESITLYQVSNFNKEDKVTQYVLSHPLFFNRGKSRVYCHDEANRPFASDATKFALFCKAVGECLLQQHLTLPNTLHLHDWHSATLAVLIAFDSRFQTLKKLKQVYTVHNLALQGTRPFKHDDSSLEAWFPNLSYDGQKICDPHLPHCYNPMRAAITLSDKVHLVSPSYAQEVLQPSDHQAGFYGGEGLEGVLQQADEQNKLVGILNGCDYDTGPEPKVTLNCFLRQGKQNLFRWMAQSPELKTVHYLASEQINHWTDSPKFTGPIISSIGRLTTQKVRLLSEKVDGISVFNHLLNQLDDVNGRMIMLGSGDEGYENEFMQLMAEHKHFLFLNGYGQSLSDDLYHLGDLFVMPSSFEPCGISQMLALRAGQPCLVHQIGGLSDTIKNNENGFCFSGKTIDEQAQQFLQRFAEALRMMTQQPKSYHTIRQGALQSRFSWQKSIEHYINQLY